MGLPRPPALTPAIVAKEEELWAVINQVLLRLPGQRERRRSILRAQKALKALGSAEALSAYMAIEALTNERHVAEMTALIRFAFDQGRRSRPGGRRA